MRETRGKFVTGVVVFILLFAALGALPLSGALADGPFNPEVIVHESSTSQTELSIAVDGNNQMLTRNNQTLSWSDDVCLTNSSFNSTRPSIVINENGTLYLPFLGNAADVSGYPNPSKAAEIQEPISSIVPLHSYYYNSPIKIAAIVNDTSGSGINNVTLYFFYSPDNSSWDDNTYYGTLFGTDYVLPWEWFFTFPMDDGYYKFYLKAVDKAGNIEGGHYMGPPTIQARCCYDSTPPIIILALPNNNSTNQSIERSILIHFSEPMNASSVESSLLIRPSMTISGYEWNANYTILNINLSSYFTQNTIYTVNINTSAKDIAGNSLMSLHSWSFGTHTSENINKNYIGYSISVIIISCIATIIFLIIKKKRYRLKGFKTPSEDSKQPFEKMEDKT